jgi:hypothetical protein
MWRTIRVVLVLASGVAAALVVPEPAASPEIGWFALLAIFAGGTVALVAVLSFQAANRHSAPMWRRPSWTLNPFDFREPLQFFHLVAYVCLAQGLGALVRFAVSSTHFFVELLVPFAMAGAAFAALSITMALFSSKVARAT